LNKVLGVYKAYATRVGIGPFPTEMIYEEEVDYIRKIGNEYGSTTGRPELAGLML